MIGERLRRTRAAKGLSLRALSDQIGNRVSGQAIGKYERDEDMPSSDVLIALARALGVSPDHLASAPDLELEGVEFRKEIASARREQEIEGRALHAVERYLAVEDLLGLRSVDWQLPRGAPYPVGDLRDAEDAARSVRREWTLGNDPIPNLAELLEERGVKVLSLNLDSIDGLAAQVRRRGREPVRIIVVRHDTWSERKRFTLAHELGHHLLDLAPGVPVEKAANRFASALLMPADAIRAEVGAHRSSISLGELVNLKIRFRVSVQALAYRCKDLGIINAATFSELFNTFAERGWRSPPFKEPASLDPDVERPKRFERLCYRSLIEKVISAARAAELLGITVDELERRLDQSEGSDEACRS